MKSTVERGWLVVVRRVMQRLFVSVVHRELMEGTCNGLLSLHPGLAQPGLLRSQEHKRKEMLSPEPLEHASLKDRDRVYSEIVNCALTEYMCRSPFYLSCIGRSNEVFAYFKQFKPNLDCKDNTKTSCLLAALQAGNTQIVEELLALNADCTSANACGDTPLIIACLKQLTPIALQISKVLWKS